MKKLGLVLLAIVAVSFQQPKTYSLKLTDVQMNQLYYCLEKSEAEHTMVTALQAEIKRQYESQVQADTTKKK